MTCLLNRGSTPLLVSMPHTGTDIPEDLRGDYVARALAVEDTDWHLPRLYNCLPALGASVLRPRYSRYVIDLNRPPDNASLYPGQATTGLCPTETFDGTAVYVDGEGVGDDEAARRREAWWRPYHERLSSELNRMRAQHGAVVLWDAHSIRSVLPRFFEGRLPDLNLGTAKGASCAPELQQRLYDIASSTPGLTAVLNGRYTGGYITRHYGDPQRGIHAVQLEMAQCTYMEEQWPFAYCPDKAAAVQRHIRRMLEAALAFAKGAG
jgi:N-formylglutamate deformylase